MNAVVYINRPRGQLGEGVIGSAGLGVIGSAGFRNPYLGSGAYGSASATLTRRQVTLEVKGTFHPLSVYVYTEADRVRQTLDARNWDVHQVTETSSGWFGQGQRTFLIVVGAETGDSDSAIVTAMRNHLAAIMTVGGVAIVRSASPSYVGSGSSGLTTTSTGAGSWFGGSSTPSVPGASTDFFGSLASSLGWSVPITALAAGLILLVILRK